MRVVEKGEVRENAIQITFSELSIMWDLNEDKEVTFLQKPSEFATQRNFTMTGFVPHLFKGEKRLMS
jgi:hypothetical protein